MMKKIFLAVSLGLILFFVGEGKPAKDVGFPRTIDAGKGRTLTLTKPPQRIVSVLLATDEILSDLVDPSRIQAVTYLAADDSISNVSAWAQEILHKIQVDIEQILACEPDLVFVAQFTRAEVVKLLLDADLLIVQIEFYNSIDDVKKNIERIAQAVGAETQAQEVILQMNEKLEEIEAKIKNIKTRPTVMSYSASGFTSGKDTTIHELIVRAGGRNVAAEHGIMGSQKVSVEKLIEWNPDVILLSSYSPGKEGFVHELRADPALQTVRAIKNNHIYVIPGKYLTTISQFVVRGVEEVARVLHPELFFEQRRYDRH